MGRSPAPVADAAGTAEEYLEFLRGGCTERERVNTLMSLARAAQAETQRLTEPRAGPSSMHWERRSAAAKPRFFFNHGKACALYIPGRRPAREGLNIFGAHLDTPHIDLKPVAVQQDYATAALIGRCDYYGGIKLYQYVGIPLHLVGYYKGKTMDTQQYNVSCTIPIDDSVVKSYKSARNFISGSNLRVILGSMMTAANFNEIISKTIGCPMSLNGVEFSLYPDYTPRYAALDRSIIASPGQDDSSGVFCAFTAALHLADIYYTPEIPVLVVCYSREEIGSYGLCGARSSIMHMIVSNILQIEAEAGARNAELFSQDTTTKQNSTDRLENVSEDGNCRTNKPPFSEYNNLVTEAELNKCFMASTFFSIDATAGIDAQEQFKSVHDKASCMGPDGKWNTTNSAVFGKGACIEKLPYTNLKLVTKLKTITHKLAETGCQTQFSTFGNSTPGGGTILSYVTKQLNCSGIDIGVPLIGMHSPVELSHIHDIWSLRELLLGIMTSDSPWNKV